MITEWRTHIGHVRSSNQDAVICVPEAGLYGVADGMGGHNGGDIASSMTRQILTVLLKDKLRTPENLLHAVKAVNKSVYERQKADAALNGMGTTLTVIQEINGYIYLAHVGDSRAYLMHRKCLRQVSHDHSLVAEMVRKGSLTKEEARHNPYRNVITRAVGTESTIDVDMEKYEMFPGDIWLICSDGLHDLLEENEIADIIGKNDIKNAVDLLIERALECGGTDNISVLLAEVEK